MIGDKIKERRLELGLTQSQLSNITGIKSTTISNYENNISSPNEKNLFLLFSALKCDANYLFEWEQNEELNLTLGEKKHIKKYRTLDEYGKRAINELLDTEYERCTYIEETEEPEEPKIEIRYSLLSVSAGSGILLGEESTEIREFPDTPEARRADIVIPVAGRSMEPMFYDGDELYVRLQPDIEIGEIGIFVMEDNGYVKEKGEDRLISLNPDYEDIYPNGYDKPRCLGKVIGKVE